MSGIIQSLRSYFEVAGRESSAPSESSTSPASSDEPVARDADEAPTESASEATATDRLKAAIEVPERPSDSYSELGMSPEALLSELISAAGGWTRQDTLVSETEWSKSTISRYLSEMEDEGLVARMPLGRTKVVGFPEVLDEFPHESAESPARV